MIAATPPAPMAPGACPLAIIRHAAGMITVHSDDVLPLTCTREGVCCRTARVWINPWELAVLARSLDLEPRVARQRLTEAGGLRLRRDGVSERPGQPACSLYRPGLGCTAHADRPLACRLFPLGRRHAGGRPSYYHQADGLPCLAHCPAVSALPHLRVDDYLRIQDVRLAEIAHDAWAARCYGMVAAATTIARQAPILAAPLRAHMEDLRHLPDEARTSLPGPGWTDILTLLPAEAPLGDPAHAADQHAAAWATSIAHRHGDDLLAAGRAYLGLALRLAPAVGAEETAMAAMLAEA